MSHPNSTTAPSVNDNERTCDALGQRIAARLSKGLDEVHPDISRRLAWAREQAVAKSAALARAAPIKASGVRSYSMAPAYAGPSGTGSEGGGNQEWHWAAKMGFIGAMLLAFGSSLVAIEQHAQTNRAREVAEVDTEILIDDLPPHAYLDSGFAQYLRMKHN